MVGIDAANSELVCGAGFPISCVIIGESLFERECQALPHYANTVDRVDDGFSPGIKEIAGYEMNQANHAFLRMFWFATKGAMAVMDIPFLDVEDEPVFLLPMCASTCSPPLLLFFSIA